MLTAFRPIALLLAALAACLPAALHADADLAAPAPALEAVARPVTPALWKIADEDTTIYLFGTIHVLPQGIAWFEGEVAKAFAASDALVTEITGEDPAKLQALVAEKALLPETQTLRGLLSEEEKAAYERALNALGVPPSMFDRFEIWYAAMGLATLPLMQDGFATDHGVEKLLQRKAAERGLKHEALETPEYQLDLFDALPLEVQKRYLSEVVEQLPTIRDDLKTMVEAWKAGDAERLAELINAEESDPVLIEWLLTNRNKAWAQWVAERLDEPGVVFLAVGAGHLAGPGSLQDQLRASGIESERIQ